MKQNRKSAQMCYVDKTENYLNYTKWKICKVQIDDQTGGMPRMTIQLECMGGERAVKHAKMLIS